MASGIVTFNGVIEVRNAVLKSRGGPRHWRCHLAGIQRRHSCRPPHRSITSRVAGIAWDAPPAGLVPASNSSDERDVQRAPGSPLVCLDGEIGRRASGQYSPASLGLVSGGRGSRLQRCPGRRRRPGRTAVLRLRCPRTVSRDDRRSTEWVSADGSRGPLIGPVAEYAIFIAYTLGGRGSQQ